MIDMEGALYVTARFGSTEPAKKETERKQETKQQEHLVTRDETRKFKQVCKHKSHKSQVTSHKSKQKAIIIIQAAAVECRRS